MNNSSFSNNVILFNQDYAYEKNQKKALEVC